MKKQMFHLTTLVAASTFMTALPVGAQYSSAAGPVVQVDQRAKSGPNANTVVDDREIALRVQAALSKDKNVAPLSLCEIYRQQSRTERYCRQSVAG
jgi:hypothetical protein